MYRQAASVRAEVPMAPIREPGNRPTVSTAWLDTKMLKPTEVVSYHLSIPVRSAYFSAIKTDISVHYLQIKNKNTFIKSLTEDMPRQAKFWLSWLLSYLKII